MELLIARLTGKSADLLSFEEVRHTLRARTSGRARLEEIPLDAIIGSVGRYTDFTRGFLPRLDSDDQRWARVQEAVSDPAGVPPIEVYQIGEVYFVRDGNHRVSVARQFGAPTIEAYVTEVRARVPLSPDARPDDLILMGEHARFLNHTRLDELRPGSDLSVTAPGKYEILLEHIAVHRHYMGLEQLREIPYEEAVTHFFDHVYSPVVEVIRDRAILRDFPGRTETDLYLWVVEHRAALEDELGWDIHTETAASHLASQFGSARKGLVARLGARVREAAIPDGLEEGVEAGTWRAERLDAERPDRMFSEILVPLSGESTSWNALDQALVVARREGADLRGLYVVPSEGGQEEDDAALIRTEFERRCEDAGASGKLAVHVGKVARSIAERSRWTDLVVVNLAHPPAPHVVARLTSGFRTLLRLSPRPVLAVSHSPSKLENALLAFDSSSKAAEALFIAAYLSGRWGTRLTVVSAVEDGLPQNQALDQAKDYLEERGVDANYVEKVGPPGESILETAAELDTDLILIGGYGGSPVLEVVLGSVVDEVLRTCYQPVLVCR
jgi:nucleotide-binding universal stress UspA family protein